MKKRYKGYFKKPTLTLVDVKYRKFTDKPRVGLWVNTYLKYINKL